MMPLPHIQGCGHRISGQLRPLTFYLHGRLRRVLWNDTYGEVLVP